MSREGWGDTNAQNRPPIFQSVHRAGFAHLNLKVEATVGSLIGGQSEAFVVVGSNSHFSRVKLTESESIE